MGNGLLPPRASRKKDPRANKRQTELGTLRQLHGGWVGGWMDGRTDERAGRQAGRQFGEGVFGAWQMQGLIAGASPGLTLAPALELQVRIAETGLGPSRTVLPGPLPAPPTHLRSFGQGSCGWLKEPHSASLGTSEASARQMGQVRLAWGGRATHEPSLFPDLPPHPSDWGQLRTADRDGLQLGHLTFSHLSTHLAWNSWLQGRTRSSCRTSKSLKQTTHLKRSTVSPPPRQQRPLPGSGEDTHRVCSD